MRTDFFPSSVWLLLDLRSMIRDPGSGKTYQIGNTTLDTVFLCYSNGRKREAIKVFSHHLFTNSQTELGTVYRSAIAQFTTYL
jgi:hypothetical protein